MSEKITEITLPRKLVQNLLHHAQQAPKQEVCGLISSQNSIPVRSYPIKNIASRPESFFTMDAQQQIQTMTEMRHNNEQLFAIYHSHPNAPAIPSSTDIQQANYPEALYLIISLNIKGVLELRGYRIKNTQFVEIPLCL